MTVAPQLVDCPRATVFVAGDDVYEDLFGVGRLLRALLTGVGFATRLRMGLSRLERAATDGDDLVVLYTAVPAFDEVAQRALTRAVGQGLGLLVVHSAAVLPSPGYDTAFALIGARYAAHGPLPHESRFVAQVDRTHELTAGIPDFEVTAEHYRIEAAPDARPLVTRDAPYGSEPVMLAREVGLGRVAYLQLGHDASVFAEPPVAELVRCSATWARRGAPRAIEQKKGA